MGPGTALEQARLFVAVWPPPEVLALVDALPRVQRPGVRWTTREQWHVTLRFLGTCEVKAAVDALAGVRASATTAVLGTRVERLGRGVLMLAVDGLDAIAAEVNRATAGVGRPPENRPFRGHLTLARLRGTGAGALADQVVGASWVVSDVTLVQSHLHPRGAHYETLLSVPLDPAVRSAP